MAKKLELNLFGSLEIRQRGILVPNLKSSKAQALLCYLAVTGQAHTRPALAGLLWGEMPETNARMNLSQALSTLRRVLGDHLSVTRQMVALKWGSDVWIDVESFESAVAVGDVEALHQAVQLYRGDLLDGFYIRRSPEFETWLLVERVRLREKALIVLQKLVKYHSAQGEAGLDAAIDYTRQLLRIEPWHEEAHRELMGHLALSGQRSAALMQFEWCRQILLEELGVEVGEETIKLYKQIREGELTPEHGDESTLTSSTLITMVASKHMPYRHNLPAQPTRFVGRDGELKSLENLIFREGKRLVTVVGPGGIGKTRLVLAFAERLVSPQNPGEPSMGTSREKFPDGIFFVSLESLNSKELILPAVAEAMRFRLDHGSSQLLGYLYSKRLLLIVDNYEHLLNGVSILSEIQNSAPGVTILVTSREPLRLHGEQVFPLQGLEFPTIVAAKSALDYPSGELFLLAARRHQPDFDLNDSELKYLAHICLLVEGMPLALELAATWVSSLPIPKIAAEIQKNYDFLATEIRNVPGRHRSVRAVFDVSWKQLTPTQKRIFAELSVFRGGFTREACKKIIGASFEDVASLVRKSFLRYVKSQDRYFVPELLRQFGAEKLAEYSEKLKPIQDRHSQHYCQWFSDQVTRDNFRSIGQKAVLDVLTIELENTRAAWIWFLKNGRIENLLGKTTALGMYYVWRGGFQKGELTFRAFVEHHDKYFEISTSVNAALLKANLLNWQAFFVYQIGEKTNMALNLVRESKKLLNSPTLAETDREAECAWNKIIMTRFDTSQSEDTRLKHAIKASALFRESDYPFGLAYALAVSARLAIQCGQMNIAAQCLAESLETCEEAGDQLGRTFALIGLGNLAFTQNDYDESLRLLGISLDIAEEMDSIERTLVSLLYMGIAETYSGRFRQAQHILERCVRSTEEQGLKAWQAMSLYCLGFSLLHLGEYDHAIKCCQVALSFAEKTKDWEIVSLSIMLPAAVSLAHRDFRSALRGFEDAARVPGSIRTAWLIAGEGLGQVGRGMALLKTGRLNAAKSSFTTLLQHAVSAHRLDQLLYAIAGISTLLAETGDEMRALELYSLAARHPFVGNSCWFEDVFGQYIEKPSTVSPDCRMPKTIDKGEDYDLWEVAEKLVNRLH